MCIQPNPLEINIAFESKYAQEKNHKVRRSFIPQQQHPQKGEYIDPQ